MVVTPSKSAVVTPLSEPGLSQSGDQGETIAPISHPRPKPPILVTFADGMLRGDLGGFYYRTCIDGDPKEAAWQMLLTCFKRQEHNAAILALTPAKDSGSIAGNSKMTQPRPQETPSGVSDSTAKAWMPGDWDRR